MDVTICIATFGGPEWIALAHERAIPSGHAQGARVVHQHAATLHDARNAALAAVRTEWVVFLDADDELEDGYLDALAEHADHGDLLVPLVAYVRGGRRRPARMPNVAAHRHACVADCLVEGNWIVVGAAARTAMLREVGGWRDFPVYEDWDLWLRCWQAGARIIPVPAAVYRAHVRPDSRNRAPDIATKNQVHRAIIAANFDPAAA